MAESFNHSTDDIDDDSVDDIESLDSADVGVESSLLETVNRKCEVFTSKFQGFKTANEISTLMLPTVRKVDGNSFSVSAEYTYVRRKKLMNSLVAVVNKWKDGGFYPLTQNLLGFRRSGKSYTLATLACLLRLKRFKVLYIHNCKFWAEKPLAYLRAEALSTFYGDSTTQQKIVDAGGIDEILDILASSKVVVIADQVGGLYEKIPVTGQGSVRPGGSQTVLLAIQNLSSETLVFTAASAQKTSAFVDCFNNCNDETAIHAFGGFSSDEFEIFRQRVPAYSGLDEEAVEKLERLTGFLPGLLTLPLGANFRMSPTPLPAKSDGDDSWIIPIQDAVTRFANSCFSNVEDKHKESHEAAVLGTKYEGDLSHINFDIVSIPNRDGRVACPSLFCKDILSDYMARLDHEHKKKRLDSLRLDIQKVDQDPTKLGDAVEDYLIAYMEVHKLCPMRLPNTLPELFHEDHIPLTRCRKFTGRFPSPLDLMRDYGSQRNSNEPIAYAYFPSGKFLRYVDFVVRVLLKTKEGEKDLMVVVAGQITLSQPVDHSQTWKFFEEDYQEWKPVDQDTVDTKFVLAWFTPHTTPDLSPYSFVNQDVEGTAINVCFRQFTGTLGKVLSQLHNPDRFKSCRCKDLCTKRCGCRKAGIPCRMNCGCRSAVGYQNSIRWG